jgi:4-amino-4-deoxy-L-arabinose transferase-like glycosyltransferase
VNLFTVEWSPFPWVDDVSLTDCPVNFVLGGEWRTTACYGDRFNEVYMVYPPLYQFLLVPFIWLFGASVIACRSLNLFLVFFICLITYRLLQKEGVLKNYYSIILFLLLFWCAATFSWIYRNGRPDILNMACTIGFLISFYKKKNNWLLALFSFLIILSGIQACPYIMGILICIYFLFSNKKRVKTAIFMFMVGTLVGLTFLSIYFYLQGHLLSFYYRSFIFSSSGTNVISFLLPYIDGIIPKGMGIKEALLKPQLSVSTPFFEKIWEAYTINKEYLILCIVNSMLYLWFMFKRKIIFKSPETKLLLITIIIPLIMAIAGRFPGYYTWMCYIPSVLYLIYIIGKHNTQVSISLICGLTTIVIASLGLPKTLINTDKDAYNNIKSFIQKQNFSAKDKIVSPFLAYYEIRNITKMCYFTGVYPLVRVPDDTKYILKADNDYGSENMDIYIKQCESKGKMVHPIDTLDSPRMILYLVE